MDNDDDPPTATAAMMQGSQLALVSVIANGYVEIAKFLDEHGYLFDSRQRNHACLCASKGDLEMVKWVHARGFERGSSGST